MLAFTTVVRQFLSIRAEPSPADTDVVTPNTPPHALLASHHHLHPLTLRLRTQTQPMCVAAAVFSVIRANDNFSHVNFLPTPLASRSYHPATLYHNPQIYSLHAPPHPAAVREATPTSAVLDLYEEVHRRCLSLSLAYQLTAFHFLAHSLPRPLAALAAASPTPSTDSIPPPPANILTPLHPLSPVDWVDVPYLNSRRPSRSPPAAASLDTLAPTTPDFVMRRDALTLG
ncbi:hypothetical protein R3P38DRAFT_2801923 [Favolaschia claudopus]|uniref:Uncharacterized protein n=1 Tax=Favolaschia claudopus TaxID=2862362 RepID=A0AAV9ZUV7_9AGAR